MIITLKRVKPVSESKPHRAPSSGWLGSIERVVNAIESDRPVAKGCLNMQMPDGSEETFATHEVHQAINFAMGKGFNADLSAIAKFSEGKSDQLIFGKI